MEYNIHQDELWFEVGATIGEYLALLSEVRTNPWSYLIIPTRIPLNSQKEPYRQKLIDGINSSIDGRITYSNYQISNWGPFSWRFKLQVDTGDKNNRVCFLYGDDIHRRLLFGDVPKETVNKIEEVLMNELFTLPIDTMDKNDYIDVIASVLMEPLASKKITIDRLHRYTDNRIRFDLVFDDIRYHLVCNTKEIKVNSAYTEFTLFFED